ncbi:DNA-binding protein [Microbulbifer mangrovi]|uniref:DNA-binding protein n=1 Tax=Microbulbifer mangrovi TaxID=927787 RepID=UPI0009907DD4|nr:DNA-binding protein [Microbulbifer mangrovi]
MARAGVGYIDVVNAAEAIRQRAEEPTVDRVRNELGTGSKSTIAPLLKRWRQETGEGIAHNHGLPVDLLDAVKALHQRVHQEAETKIQQINESCNAATTALGEELAALRTQLASRNTELEKLEQKLQGSTSDCQQLKKNAEERQAALAKSEFLREQGDTRITELQDTIGELKQENRDVRQHFEHFQQQIADDRQLERDQFRLTSDQLRHQLAETNEQLSTAVARLEDSQANVEALQAQKLGLESERAQWMRRESEIDAVRKKQDQLLDELRAQMDIGERETEGLKRELAAERARNEAYVKEIELRSNVFDRYEREVHKVREKLAAVEAENRQVLQDKAILQGKFAQLQQSLEGANAE